MREAILIYKKKKYINWFLKNHKLKRPETEKILKFLLKNDTLLLKTYFVEDVRRLPNALLISATEAATVSFLCRLNDDYLDDIDVIINNLGLNPPEDLFVWLSFDRESVCSLCGIVPEVKSQVHGKVFYHQVIKDIEHELNQSMEAREKRINELKAEIDKALEKRDREKFLKLSEKYRNLIL